MPPNASAAYVLEAKQLSVTRGRHVVLSNIDLSVSAGEAIALVGSNGSGKTTLLQCLAGILRPFSGEVRWWGETATRKRPMGAVGFLGHESGLYPTLTVQENLLFAARMFGIGNPREQVASMLDHVGLTRQAHTQVADVSKGIRQRSAIARALIHNPRVLLLDEPFTSLDLEWRNWLADLLDELRSNHRAIVLSDHDSPPCSVNRTVELQPEES